MSGTSERIDLASMPDFQVGGLSVSPSACRVSSNGVESRIEPKVMEVLIVLARGIGRTVTRDELIEACWGGRAVSDDAVSRVIAKVRQIGRGAEPPHFTLETLPKVGFRLELVAAGSGTAAAEHDGASPAALAEGSALPSPSVLAFACGWRKAGIGVVLLAVLLILAWFALRPQGLTAGDAPVAVSTFRALHATPELDSIAMNATTALFRALTQTGVTTVMTQDGSRATDANQAALDIGGTVDRNGDTYRITATITQRSTGRVLWSHAFQRDQSDLQGIDGEAAHDTALVLGCAQSERPVGDGIAPDDIFALLLRACAGATDFPEVENAVQATRRLVDSAPALAAAHAFRAIALEARASQIDYLEEDARKLRQDALAAAKRALALDPKSVRAHLAMNAVLVPTTDLAAREYHLRRALAIEPDHAGALNAFGTFLRETGRLGAAREVFRRLETTAVGLVHGIFLSAMNGDFGEVARLQALLANMRLSWVRSSRVMVVAFWVEPKKALAALPGLGDAVSLPGRACLHGYLEKLAQGAKPQQNGLPAECEAITFDWRVRMLARLGNVEASYAMLSGPTPNSRRTTIYLFYPEMKAFRHDKRFMALAERLGLLAYWRRSNEWPDFCAEPDLPYDCRTWRAEGG